MGKFVTIKDIAKQLNISPSTVSRALNNSNEISSKLKAQVIDLATKLGYQPDRIATGLKHQKTKLIGVVVPSIEYNFNVKAIQGIEAALIPNGYKVIITQTMESYEREKENIKYLISSKVDGIIVSVSAETKEFSHLEFIRKRDIPLVLIDRSTKYVEASEIVIDNEEATYKGTRHLIELGCKNIIWLQGPKDLAIADLRRRGYQKALEDNNIAYDKSLIGYCNFNDDMGYKTIKTILQTRNDIDGIFAINDRLAIGAMAAIHDMNKKIPSDIALLGFNNEPFDSLLNPSLSSIYQPSFDMGMGAGKLILRHLSEERFMPQHKIFKTNLIIRNSSSTKIGKVL